jgi:hypothetical protein
VDRRRRCDRSTKAIEAGAYKKVNTVGVACIAAVVNVDEVSICRLSSAAMARRSPCRQLA